MEYVLQRICRVRTLCAFERKVTVSVSDFKREEFNLFPSVINDNRHPNSLPGILLVHQKKVINRKFYIIPGKGCMHIKIELRAVGNIFDLLRIRYRILVKSQPQV